MSRQSAGYHVLTGPAAVIRSSLRLTRAEKEALDLLSAWPLCTTGQLAGLVSGVIRRRANQVLRSLTQHGLVCADKQRHVLTDEGLNYLTRRDRAAVGPVLARWSPRPRGRRRHAYAGTSLRAMASQPRHHDAVTNMASALASESTPFPRLRVAGSPAHLPLRRGVLALWHQLRHSPRRLIHPGPAGRPLRLLPRIRVLGQRAQAGT